MMDLAYGYKAKSDLPRDHFVVNAESFSPHGTDYHGFAVTAPDYIEAERLARRAMNAFVAPLPGTLFRLVLVRRLDSRWVADGVGKAPVIRLPGEWG